MAELRLYRTRAAYDEVMATGIKRRHEPPRIVGDLLSAEIADTGKRQLAIAIPRASTVTAHAAASTPSSPSSISWRAKRAPAARDGSPITSSGSTFTVS